MAFEDVIRVLDETAVVAIVTTKRDGDVTPTPIWSVVVDGVPYVRSAYGGSSWWCRHVIAGRPVAFVTEDGKISETDRAAALELPREAVTLEHIAADAPEQDAISAEIERKYAGSRRSSIDATISEEALAFTFRVVA